MGNVKRGLMVAGLALLLANTGHSFGVRQDAGVAFAVETVLREKQSAPATFIMGGIVFQYADEDWTAHQASLADALTETYLGMLYGPTHGDRRQMGVGYSLLLTKALPDGHAIHNAQLRLLGLNSIVA